MAQYGEWLHTAHSSASKPTTGHGFANPASWTSEEDDTESESEQSFRSFECRRKKEFGLCSNMRAPRPAAPVTIPARTHDFGWCDRDDARSQRETACPCGDDCDQFFTDDAQNSLSQLPSPCAPPRQEELTDDFIFDMEL